MKSLTAGQKAALKRRQYGMYTPDGDLRVAEHIVQFLNDEKAVPERLNDLRAAVKDMQDAVASDGEWCREVKDTVVFETIITTLFGLLTGRCGWCFEMQEGTPESAGWCVRCAPWKDRESDYETWGEK